MTETAAVQDPPEKTEAILLEVRNMLEGCKGEIQQVQESQVTLAEQVKQLSEEVKSSAGEVRTLTKTTMNNAARLKFNSRLIYMSLTLISVLGVTLFLLHTMPSELLAQMNLAH